MEEYKFRGKRLDNNEWVYGDLIQLHDGKRYIVNNKFGACIDDKCNFINTESPFVCGVIPETVEQYTQLKESRNLIGEYDKKEIYKGDIIQENGWDDLYVVKFEDCKFIAKHIHKPTGNIFTRYNKDLDGILFPIVIGNIYENPELLGKARS